MKTTPITPAASTPVPPKPTLASETPPPPLSAALATCCTVKLASPGKRRASLTADWLDPELP